MLFARRVQVTVVVGTALASWLAAELWAELTNIFL